jgi:hypothetical protein
MLVVAEGTPAPSCPSHNCAPASGNAPITSAWDATTGQWTDLAPPPSLGGGVTLPGSLAPVWTGKELLILGTVSCTEPSPNPGPGKESRWVPHVIVLRLGS